MTALLSTGFEITPSSNLRTAQSSLRKLGARLFVTGLAMSALVLLAGWILLESAAGFQLNGAALDARPEAVTALQGSPPVWEYSLAPLPPRLPREWAWEIRGARFDHMWRKPR
jgi:hypothetical protein